VSEGCGTRRRGWPPVATSARLNGAHPWVAQVSKVIWGPEAAAFNLVAQGRQAALQRNSKAVGTAAESPNAFAGANKADRQNRPSEATARAHAAAGAAASLVSTRRVRPAALAKAIAWRKAILTLAASSTNSDSHRPPKGASRSMMRRTLASFFHQVVLGLAAGRPCRPSTSSCPWPGGPHRIEHHGGGIGRGAAGLAIHRPAALRLPRP